MTNTGGGTLTIGSMASGGANPADFARFGDLHRRHRGWPLAPVCTITYMFRPTAPGNRSASLAVGTGAGTISVGLSGKATRR